MRWKAVKKFPRVFLTAFCSECGESRWNIYFHGTLSIIKKNTSWQVVRTSHLLVVSNSLFHCPNSHVLLSYFLWIQENVRNRMQWIFIRDAVKDGEKNFIAYFLHLFTANAVNRGEFFFTAFLVLLKKALLDKWLKRLTSWLFPTPFSTAPTLMYFYHISCEFRKTLETECSEFLSEMRWEAVKKIHRVFLTAFCSECGESRWITYFHGILGII